MTRADDDIASDIDSRIKHNHYNAEFLVDDHEDYYYGEADRSETTSSSGLFCTSDDEYARASANGDAGGYRGRCADVYYSVGTSSPYTDTPGGTGGAWR